LQSVQLTKNRFVRFRPYYCGLNYLHPEGLDDLFDSIYVLLISFPHSLKHKVMMWW